MKRRMYIEFLKCILWALASGIATAISYYECDIALSYFSAMPFVSSLTSFIFFLLYWFWLLVTELMTYIILDELINTLKHFLNHKILSRKNYK